MNKIIWIDTDHPLVLAARTKVMPRGYEIGISERDMEPIAEWVKETGIGRRTSFDTIKFKNKADMSMFLLRWSNH